MVNLWAFLWRAAANQAVILSFVAVLGMAFGGLELAIQAFQRQIDLSSAVGAVAGALSGLPTLIIGAVVVRNRTRRTRARFQSPADIKFEWAVYSLTLAFLLAFGGLFVPGWLSDFLEARGGGVSFAWLGIIGAAILGAATAAGPFIAVLRPLAKDGLPKGVSGKIARVVGITARSVYRVLQALVGLMIPFLLILTFYGAWAIMLHISGGEWVFVAILVAYILFWNSVAIISDGAQQFSPFQLYRKCLANCYDVIRQYRNMDPLPDGSQPVQGAYRARQRNVTPLMSRLQDLEGVPELLICASVNLSEVGTTAAGAYARQLVFSPYTIEIAGIPDAKLWTTAVEKAIADRRTLREFDGSVLSCVAVTGAAVSPTMGKFTRSWLRALICFLNLRLGVWILNPASEDVRSALPLPEEARPGSLDEVSGESEEALVGSVEDSTRTPGEP
ncbi:MAG: hypothetical protein H0W86_13965, partial [Armatimonadetes bacterium]|nr:hypothetical protein [Armatimonadota bacterium]